MGNLSITKRRKIAQWLAPWMCFASLLFLVILAGLMVLWVDVPRVSLSALEGTANYENLADSQELFDTKNPWNAQATRAGFILLWLLLALWPLFIAECGWTLWSAHDQELPKYWKRYRIAMCFLPPLRLCPVHPDMQGRLWLPLIGWRRADEKLKRSLERSLSFPMVAVALAILPVLIVEWTLHKQVTSTPWLRIVLHVATGFIWFAFTTEYLVMLSVSRRKVEHFKKHIIDLIIIVLPLVSFLRSLQALRATRLAKLAKLEQLSRMMRIYRLRGLSMRMLRGLLVLEILHRLLGQSPEKRLLSLRDDLQRKEEEIAELKVQVARLEKEVEARAAKRKQMLEDKKQNKKP